MAYGTVNADVIGTSVAGSNLGAGNASIMKNRIINGAMVIDQRNAGASVTPTATAYTLDRWNAFCNVSSKFSVQQSTTAPTGFVNSLKVTSASAYTIAAGEFTAISQAIEGFNVADLGFGTANAKTVTLSFQVYSSLTGTFGGSLANGAGSRSYPFTYTISSANTWTTISITIAGDTTGTWLTTNGAGLQVFFGLGCGSTWSGTAGAWAGSYYLSATGATSVVGTNGATFYITGVQLEVGSSATGFEYRLYNQELIACQRYYNRFDSIDSVYGSLATVGFIASGSTAYFTTQFPVTMRSSPTLLALITTSAVGPNLSGPVPTGYALDQVTKYICRWYVSGLSGGTTGYAAQIYANNSSTQYVSFSAEL